MADDFARLMKFGRRSQFRVFLTTVVQVLWGSDGTLTHSLAFKCWEHFLAP